MYLCYVDESGINGKKFNPEQPVQTMVGIFPNLYNFHKSDSEFREVFKIIKKQIPVSELKAHEIYRGRKSWKSIKPEVRDQVIEYYFKWISTRNHKFIVTSIDNGEYFKIKNSNKEHIFFKHFAYPWLLSAFHISLIIQKSNRNKPSNKGKTILIFDQEDTFEDQLCNLIYNPPSYIDEFVSFDPKKETQRLEQIIDSAYYVRSHHSSMAQVVDILCYFLRLHIELEFYGFDEAYEGEKMKISNWLSTVKDKFIPMSFVYPKKKSDFNCLLNDTRAKDFSW